MKNSRVRTWFIFSFLVIIFLGIVYFSNYRMHVSYQKAIYEIEAERISYIIEKYPELEEEIMSALLSENGSIIQGKELLLRYGIEEGNIDVLRRINVLKNNMLEQNMLFIIFIFICFSCLFYFYTRKEKKQIEKIHSYLDQVLNGDYSLDVRDYEENSLSTLKDGIYKMTVILREKENYSRKEKQHLESVLSDISHQLKTPLTSMYVINDILENNEIDSIKKKEMLGKNRNQLKRIEWLVTSLLKLSRLDSGMVTMKQEVVSIKELVEHALEPLLIPMELKNQTVTIEENNKIEVVTDSHWTREAIINIIKNAHEHTSDGGNIKIQLLENPIYVEVNITDDGEGISKEDLPYIFKRFYKGSGNKESIGIGLNMAKTILNQQNTYVSVLSEKEKGTTFTIKFYKKEL